MEYGPDDITILNDAIGAIRRNPNMYGGEPPRSARLAAQMMRDLILEDNQPVSAEKLDGWWFITCQKDWLSGEGTGKSSYWFRMIPTPHMAVNSIREEVILTALSKGLFTIANGQLGWIVPSVDLPVAVDMRVKRTLASDFKGRIVAFIAD